MSDIHGNPHGASILSIIVFGLVVVPFSFGLRLWARWVSAVAFWWDDLLMGFALAGALGVVADNIVGLHHGEGYHANDLSHKDIEKYAQTVFAFFFLQTTTVTLIKISLLILYRRTFTIKRFRYVIYAIGAIILANACENIFGFLFQCIPVRKFWTPMLPGHCINQSLFITLASTFYIMTDFAIYVMPMPVIWHLQITKRRKYELSIVFLVGGFVCITGIARIIYTIRLDVKDLTFSNADPAIWNMVESQVGFVAANIPLMGPLFSKVSNTARRLGNTYGSQSFEHENHGSIRHTAPQHSSNRGFERMMDDDRVGVKATVQPRSPEIDNEFSDTILMNGFVVKANLEQNYKQLSSREGL